MYTPTSRVNRVLTRVPRRKYESIRVEGGWSVVHPLVDVPVTVPLSKREARKFARYLNKRRKQGWR